jgi:hypothetical protein
MDLITISERALVHRSIGPTLAGVWTLRRSGAGLLQSQPFRQPFPVPRYSEISDLPCIASVVKIHLCYVHNHPRCAGPIDAIVILVSVRPFSNSVRRLPTSCTHITSPYSAINFCGRNTSRPQNPNNHAQTISQCVTIAHQQIP